MSTENDQNRGRVQARLSYSVELDNLVAKDAAACGMTKPAFLAVCIRHGRESARAAILGAVIDTVESLQTLKET